MITCSCVAMVYARGSLFPAGMIQEWIATDTCDYRMRFACKIRTFVNIMLVRQEVLSGITPRLGVDQLVKNMIILPDSIIMTKFCRHYWKVIRLPWFA